MSIRHRPIVSTARNRTGAPAIAHAAHALAVVAVIVLAHLLGCARPQTQLQPQNPAVAQEVLSPLRAVRATDATLRARVSSYVGLSIEPGGSVRIALADPSETATAINIAEDVWRSVLPQGSRSGIPEISVVETVAGPAELRDPMTKMRNVLTLPGVVFLSLDKVCGCIAVGIATPTVEAEVADFSQKQGIRVGLVKTTPSSYVVQTANLAGDFRPMIQEGVWGRRPDVAAQPRCGRTVGERAGHESVSRHGIELLHERERVRRRLDTRREHAHGRSARGTGTPACAVRAHGAHRPA